MQVSDGAETVLSPARADALWVEGDQLLLLGGTYGTQLFSLPVTGGTPTLIADGTAGRTELGIGQLGSHLPTAIDFFFAESSRTQFHRPHHRVARAPHRRAAHGDRPLHRAAGIRRQRAALPGRRPGARRTGPGRQLGRRQGRSPRRRIPANPGGARGRQRARRHRLRGRRRARRLLVGTDARTSTRPWADQLVISPADGGAVRPVWSHDASVLLPLACLARRRRWAGAGRRPVFQG